MDRPVEGVRGVTPEKFGNLNRIWCILAYFSGAFLFQNGKMDPRQYVSHAGLSKGWQQHVQTIITMVTVYLKS
jgi:hypothetical protein